MKRKYFGWEQAFEFIWKNADDGMWDGDASTMAAEFGVTEDEGHETLSDLADQGLIEKLCTGKFAIANWSERDDPGEQEVTC
jgi:hypothetical protein